MPARFPRHEPEGAGVTVNGWTCPHGIGPEGKRGDCRDCNVELIARRAPHDMTGDELAEEVRALLNEANAYRIDDIHARLEVLVGRSVWTHEFATDTRLIEEARGALPHPEDLEQHLVDSARALLGNKPVVVVRVNDP